MDQHTPVFGVDLFAFWHEDVFGLESVEAVVRRGAEEPRELWDVLLDRIVASGVSAIELTFAPFDWRTGAAAYGSTRAFLDELGGRGLSVCGGYLPALERPEALATERRSALLEDVRAYTDFLAQAGATALIGSAPLRSTRGSVDAVPVDLRTVQALSDPFHDVGRVAHAAGLRFGLHTESHSAMWLERDIDLFMLATDPFYVGLCPDAAHITLGGGDAVAVARRHRDRLVSAHWKDSTGTISWDLTLDESVHVAHRAFCGVPGTGVVDWAAWTEVMTAAGLTDPVLLEVDAIATPVQEIRAAIEHLTPLLRAAPSAA
ncbi:sugar phosphate isomerase/epimerase family protein [Rathayibacter sp. VKM Ac-2754]|uniref:sugar phosphate isomerase/epimerase family protein n=1 Tax=Rathayibacter sp. VKM Ac-2754 TaxID=2609251 RepID=UPI00135BB348|nr:sugar phosphate isomerase/epimerase [Rathayibacter sp. VKM Ac-2754]MWV60125.1 TIM barrel protein [Rathayibacter sp. VKM Ac-2754]